MPIAVACSCGKRFRAPDAAAGRRGKCPACGATLQVPAGDAAPLAARPLAAPAPPPPVPAADPDYVSDPSDYGAYDLAPTPSPVRVAYPAGDPSPTAYPTMRQPAMPAFAPPAVVVLPPQSWPSATRVAGPLFIALFVALLPLVWFTLAGRGSPTLDDRIQQTLQHHPELEEMEQGAGEPDESAEMRLFNALPEHRIEGALHSRETKMHWFYALLATGIFFGGAIWVLPRAAGGPMPLLWAGLFTGTLGVLLLLGVQLAAAHTYGVILTGRGIVMLIFNIIKFIGFSYHAATDPNTGMLASLFGFTFGVGLCEELCKALPVIWAIKTQRFTGGWRDACRWGFLCGVGFGVSEGIMYSGDYYNGYDTGGIYVVRFISCVALHATWSSAAAIALFRRQGLLHNADHWGLELLSIIGILIVPMALHGLYDTLLKKEHDVGALFVAVLSVAWLAWNVWRTMRVEDDDPELGAHGLPV